MLDEEQGAWLILLRWMKFDYSGLVWELLLCEVKGEILNSQYGYGFGDLMGVERLEKATADNG